MFTDRGQRYVPDKNHLAVFFLESHAQVPNGVLTQPAEKELVGLGDAPGRAPQAFSFRVLPYGSQYLPDSALDPRPVYPVVLGKGPFQLFKASLCQLHGKGELLVGCNSPLSYREKRNGSSSSCDSSSNSLATSAPTPIIL